MGQEKKFYSCPKIGVCTPNGPPKFLLRHKFLNFGVNVGYCNSSSCLKKYNHIGKHVRSRIFVQTGKYRLPPVQETPFHPKLNILGYLDTASPWTARSDIHVNKIGPSSVDIIATTLVFGHPTLRILGQGSGKLFTQNGATLNRPRFPILNQDQLMQWIFVCVLSVARTFVGKTEKNISELGNTDEK